MIARRGPARQRNLSPWNPPKSLDLPAAWYSYAKLEKYECTLASNPFLTLHQFNLPRYTPLGWHIDIPQRPLFDMCPHYKGNHPLRMNLTLGFRLGQNRPICIRQLSDILSTCITSLEQAGILAALISLRTTYLTDLSHCRTHTVAWHRPAVWKVLRDDHGQSITARL